ncbi:hypothetical protein BJY24_004127 [Nocardia transvalensis]|uniref:Uncharacterized protein n=1 Tax=Nocardia transvalensis TaxID=37333 RepID=A0A7W9PFS3_9NOCA|nr:hypothetical protein [Nocardia transvalensis]MBB5915260.1 hypothetical protein [Nocardia transvalensis]
MAGQSWWRRPTAMPWIDLQVSTAPEWDAAQVRRLARELGYVLIEPPENSLLTVVDHARTAAVDALICPGPAHLDVYTLHALMTFLDVEIACPRESFARFPIYGARPMVPRR